MLDPHGFSRQADASAPQETEYSPDIMLGAYGVDDYNTWMDAQYELQRVWAAYYGLTQAGVDSAYGPSWQRLFNRHPRSYNVYVTHPPHSDHSTLWRRVGSKGFEAPEVFVTQPYFSETWVGDMKAFAEDKGLRCWISERPAWHNPRSVRHVEWARPESKFAHQRDTTEAHQLQKTLFCFG